MLRQIGAWEDRERNAGADLHSSLVIADEAESNAAVLSPHVHQPYFGSLRLRVAGQDRAEYVGRHAFRDLRGGHHVVSWESQIGALYYAESRSWQTPRGLTGTVRRRRQLDIEDQTLRRVTDLHDDEVQGSGGREAVLRRRLAEAAQTTMRDVVETLQPEQSGALRQDPRRPLLLQGPAGSGKTTILFHRLAWLVHPERGEDRVDPAQTLILMPNRVLAAYASRMLPGLGVSGAGVTTPEAWMLGYLGLEKMEVVDRTLTLLLTDRSRERRRLAWRHARLLGDLRMLAVVQGALETRLLANVRPFEVPVAGTLLTVPPAVTGRLISAALGSVAPLRPRLRAALLAEVQEQASRQAATRSLGERELERETERALTPYLSKLTSGLLPVSEARRILGDAAALAAGGFTPGEVATLLSGPLSAVPQPRRSHADLTELPVMLAITALLDGLGRRDGREVRPYDHILLDEAQDFSPLLYALLALASDRGRLSALGDSAQGLFGFRGINVWAEAEAAVQQPGVPPAGRVRLTRSFRSTRPINDLTSRLAATYSKEGAYAGVDRAGPPVVCLVGQDQPALVAQAVRAMQARGLGNIGIVTRRPADAADLSRALEAHDVAAAVIGSEHARYEGGVVAIPVSLAKGLEFDGCVVPDADDETYPGAVEYERRVLYIAASRGLHELALTTTRTLHPLLASALAATGPAPTDLAAADTPTP